MKALLYSIFFFSFGITIFCQDLEPTENLTLVRLKLKNIKCGIFRNVEVTFTNDYDKMQYKSTSDNDGWVLILLPKDGNFEVKRANYFKPWKLPFPNRSFSTYESEYKYPAVSKSLEEKYPMSSAEKAKLVQLIKTYPDTTIYKASGNNKRKASVNFVLVKINLQDLKKGPLKNETLFFTGRKHGKTFMGKSDNTGQINFLLPKGDTYDMHFTYDKNYELITLGYSKGFSSQRFHYTYLGSKEIEKRREEEKKRLIAYEKRLEEERIAHEKYLKKLAISEKEYLKREALISKEKKNLINIIFERNKQWSDKLIVCDLTGSMHPYAAQLLAWYALNYMKDKNLQFVFFNDGDNKPDNRKKIGETGGIYYSKSDGFDNLVEIMSNVQIAGNGGGGLENNLEALIKGTAQASNYKDIIMIVDNYAPVKDIKLLSKFNQPVHIILCGAAKGYIHQDYLEIALKTKGTVHTIEEDISALSELSEGKEITIMGSLYKMVKGKLIKIEKA